MSVLDTRARFAQAERFQSMGRNKEAAEAWVEALAIDPAYWPGHLALVEALVSLGLLDAAVTAFCNALLAAPASAADALQRSCHRLTAALRAEGRLDLARAILERLLVSSPRDAGTLFLLAGIKADLGAAADGIRDLRRALVLQPRFPEALNTLGVLLRANGDLAQAEACYRRAIAQRSNYSPAWNNLANLHVELSRLDEAARCYSKAVTHLPDYAEAHTNRALVWLLQGKFPEGWKEYEWRWRQPGTNPRRLPRPEWDGAPLAGKTILLHAEQGAGDTIQFIRYARLLRRQGASIVLHCQESLQSLLSGMPELACVISGRAPSPAFDVHAPLMSLPRLCGTIETSIPCEVPYLRPLPGSPVPEALLDRNRFRVGLVWAGNPSHRNDRNRSCPLELFDGLLQTNGVQFYSLQVGHGPFPDRPIVDLAPYLTDYAATAACLAHLDLLITVDTSVAHLAGALGRPVWMLLPTCNDWRWLEQRDDTPWYPTMRLLRQSARGDWKTVLERANTQLKEELNANHDRIESVREFAAGGAGRP